MFFQGDDVNETNYDQVLACKNYDHLDKSWDKQMICADASRSKNECKIQLEKLLESDSSDSDFDTVGLTYDDIDGINEI